MSDTELEHAEQVYLDMYQSASRNDKHMYYARVGSVIGLVFVIISALLDSEFYRFFGTFGMAVLNGVAGICMLFAVISLLPGYKRDNKMKWDIIEMKRKELEKLRKAKKK